MDILHLDVRFLPATYKHSLLTAHRAASVVASVLGVGILALGYIAKLAGAISGIVALDAARAAASVPWDTVVGTFLWLIVHRHIEQSCCRRLHLDIK